MEGVRNVLFHEIHIEGVYIIEPEPFMDSRGMFARISCAGELEDHGLEGRIAQVNRSRTNAIGAVRGMHYQHPPMAEVKIVSCICGRVFDVVVDLRAGSPTMFQWFGTELSVDNMRAIYIPKGFAHGFQVLTPDSELLYFHSEAYSPSHEGGVRWDDPRVAVKWPLAATDISERDKNLPLLTPGFTGITVDCVNKEKNETHRKSDCRGGSCL